jgi:uncharacterized protein YdaU (DUF1376 family)
MAALPYMQLYVSDYLADTAHLSAAQHGAYLLLIFNYWQRGQALSNVNERLANVARMSDEEWWENKNALAEFFVIDGDTWKHPRIEADLAAVTAKSIKASAAGHASAVKRAGATNKRPTRVQQSVNHKEAEADTEAEAEKERLATPRGAQRLPATWEPSAADVAFCQTERPDLSPGQTAARFRDYWIAQPGAKGRKADWPATWRNWVRNEKAGSAAHAANPGGLSPAGASTRAAAQDWMNRRGAA